MTLREIQPQPGHKLIVAEDEQGRILGCLQLTILAGLSRKGPKRATIEAVRVGRDQRDRGLSACRDPNGPPE